MIGLLQFAEAGCGVDVMTLQPVDPWSKATEGSGRLSTTAGMAAGVIKGAPSLVELAKSRRKIVNLAPPEVVPETPAIVPEAHNAALFDLYKKSLSEMETRKLVRPQQSKLQHTFGRHAKQLGFNENWSNENGKKFFLMLEEHVKNPAIVPISGTYRGNINVIHYYDPITKIDVMVDLDENLVGAWVLQKAQIDCLLNPDIRNVQ